ncbi:hypothetical protein LOK46_24280 [Methylobacterium sp. NMS14P]|uniref:hypothetical protein n=1 Tax=Methylobacterium sp. NMS14P TaxID=2894310 RepID=UPI002358F1D2|nr:hypothetical protein [Methylobacterium sp. NMS14P]WCS24226.1 hypothetical protein LOK46_24280 [Methylobacterium sp. NMS14P]
MMMPIEFWLQVERDVSAKVDGVLNLSKVQRQPVITYLRDLEVMARTACDRRQTVQIIASGRSLLGDRTAIGPHDGPFAHAFA